VATVTIRQLDDVTRARLRVRAAENGRSVEAEVRAILDAAVGRPTTNVLVALRQAVGRAGGVDLEIPDRSDRPRPVEL